MVKVTYDVSDVESGGGGEEPQPGMYKGEIVGITHRTKKKNTDDPVNDLEVVVDIGSEYTRKYTYVKLPGDPSYENSKWKLRELTDALGLGPKGSIDTAPNLLKKLYKTVNVKIMADTDQNGEYRGKIKNLFAPANLDGDDATDAEASGDGDGPYGREEIESWSDDDVKGYADELDVEIPKGRNWRNRLIDALVDAEEGTEDGAGDHDASSNGSPLTDGLSEETLAELKDDADYYDDWSDADLKEFINDLRIDGNVPTSGRGWRAKAVKGIVDFAQAANGGAPSAEVEDNYEDEDEWPTSDLKAEIDNRNEQGADITIEGRSTRAKMIAALREDDLAAVEPF